MAMFCPKNSIFPLLAVSFALEGVGNALLSGADEALFYEGIREDGDEQLYGKIRGNRQLIGSIVLGVQLQWEAIFLLKMINFHTCFNHFFS